MTIEEIEKIAKKEELSKEEVVMYYCPKPYGYTQSCDSNGEIKDYYKTLICEKCWFDAKKNVPDINVGSKNEITLYKVMKALSDYCESQNCGKCPLWKRGPCLLTCYIPCNYNEDVLPCLSEESITLKIEE